MTLLITQHSSNHTSHCSYSELVNLVTQNCYYQQLHQLHIVMCSLSHDTVELLMHADLITAAQFLLVSCWV